MKKVLLIAIIAISTLTVSCRQSEQEEIFSPEDQANLKVLKDSANNFQARKDSTNIINKQEDGELIPPPKK